MAVPQHTRLRRERRIGRKTRDGQVGILARAVEVEVRLLWKRRAKVEMQNTMGSGIQMHMGAVRTRRREGIMCGGALDEGRLPRDLGMIITCAVDA